MKRTLSFRAKALIVFLSVTFVIILTFFLMNRFFWKTFYARQDEKLVRKTYQDFAVLVAEKNTTADMLMDKMEAVKLKNNISVAIQGAGDWDFMVAVREMTSAKERMFLLERLQEDFLNPNPADNVTVIEHRDDFTLQRVEVAETGRRYLECYGYLPDNQRNEKKFIISMPLEQVYNISNLSDRYMILLSIVLIILGGAAISFFAYRMTKPILQLSDISKRMSMLDFSARYIGDNRDEIGVLGNNMNEMSSQLERTIRQLQMANEELQKDIEEKNQQDEMRRDFISNVSHELKTPIALIQGYAEGLREVADDPDSMAYYCDVIVDEAEKMNRMVKKLTTLNQLEFGADGLEIETFDIMDMIRGLVRNSAKMQEDLHARVTVEGPKELLVLGDEFKIEEVLTNYYSNAFNHLSEPNEIRIWTDDLGPKVRISVQNTGDRIPEEELSKIWIKFYKIDKARTRAYGGSGIGLSIVKAIMEAHGNEYGVYNEAAGPVFWLELGKAENGEDRRGMGEGADA